METELRHGKIFSFAGDEGVKVEIMHKTVVRGIQVFNIYLNGKLHHAGEKFHTAERKIKRLKNKYNLVEVK